MKVVGVSARVSNDDMDSIEEAWELFAKSEVIDYLNGANLSQEIISVYHEYEGTDEDPYTLLIGYEVADDFETPNGLNEVIINLNHETYNLEGEMPDAIIDKWEEIWEDESRERAFIADFDKFDPRTDTAQVCVEYK